MRGSSLIEADRRKEVHKVIDFKSLAARRDAIEPGRLANI
jgi:hypothetical protein